MAGWLVGDAAFTEILQPGGRAAEDELGFGGVVRAWEVPWGDSQEVWSPEGRSSPGCGLSISADRWRRLLSAELPEQQCRRRKIK